MAKVRVTNFSVSLDGFAAGPDQSRDDPLGVGGEHLHDWAFATRTFRGVFGMEGGDEGVDDAFAARGDEGFGATLMGRNMFGPIRGPWGHEQWNGWWGDDPPYHHPVFVLTHHRRPPVAMQGGTTFHFVDGIETALQQALDAATGADVKIAGGAATIRQYLHAGLIDEMHLAVTPVLLGAGERLFEGLERIGDGYECVELVCSPSVAHVRVVRKAAG